VNVLSGTLLISGGGSDSGGYSVSSGAFLGFHGTRNVASSITGAGNVTLGGSGAAQPAIQGVYNITGRTSITGNGDFGSSATTGQLDISGGAVRGGSGSLTASGPFTWSGGQLESGATIADGGMTLFGTSLKTVGGAMAATLINNATATQSGNLQIGNNGSQVLNNGTYNMASSANIVSGLGSGVLGNSPTKAI
jgi:hypothetical protein